MLKKIYEKLKKKSPFFLKKFRQAANQVNHVVEDKNKLTNKSNQIDKITSFRSLFKGREDCNG